MKICSKILKNPVVSNIKKRFLAARCTAMNSPQEDVLVLSAEAALDKKASIILSKSKKFNIDDYNSLSKMEKAVLREVSAKYKTDVDATIQMAEKIKKKLDRDYGQGNYVFCSIGTSPASTARALEFMGVETKYFPISDLYWYHKNSEYKKFEPLFSNYQKFLNQQGMSKEDVSKSKKRYLFYDYTFSGISLEIFKNMMKENFGLDLPNVKFHSMDYLCYSSCAKKIDPSEFSVDYVTTYMREGKSSELCGIPHLPIDEIDKIDSCLNYESSNAKKFNFLLIDELSRKGLAKYNHLNKNSL